jgi:hypothetical protein
MITAQIALLSQIGSNKSPEDLLKILLIAIIPHSKESFIKLAEEREKQLKIKQKEQQ